MEVNCVRRLQGLAATLKFSFWPNVAMMDHLAAILALLKQLQNGATIACSKRQSEGIRSFR
jgi:hypothetical protein